MEDLSLDNIVGDIDNLFIDEEITEESTPDSQEESQEESTKNTETTEVDADNLFAEVPESVGSVKSQEEEDTISDKKQGASPKNNFYSSIAKALQEDGVFSVLDDVDAEEIVDAEGFAEFTERQVQAKLDEKQRRIDEALNAKIEASVVQQYENTLSYLDNLTEDTLSAETTEGENLRKQLIYQDFINRGYSKEQATRRLQQSLDRGNDIDDAKEALESNREFFKKGYNDLIKESKEKVATEEKERKNQAELLKKSILEDNKVFGEISLDKATRQKVYDNISKPIYKDKDTGELYTAIQKYEKENKTDFLKNIGLLYTLTDGFKNIDSLVKGRVRKEVKKGLKELEHTLNNTQRTSDGNLRFVSGVDDDSESFIGRNWDLNV